MDVLPEGKNFRLAQEEELPAILDFLEKYLPDSIKFHQTLKTYLNDRVWDFYFYVSKSWPEEPVILHFPGVTKTPHGKLYESFNVFCPGDQLEHLELLKTEDMLLEWNEPMYLNFTHSLIMDRIEEFYSGKGTIEKVCGEVFALNGIKGADSDLEFSKDFEILQLTREHAQIIHDLYPANHMESIEVFEKLFQNLPSFGIFSSSGELAAWMVQSYYGAMFSMQTRPEYRRKGYGMYIAKYLTDVVMKRGYLPFVIIRPENDASKSLYSKLGFKKNFETVRAILRPHVMDNDAQGGGTSSP